MDTTIFNEDDKFKIFNFGLFSEIFSIMHKLSDSDLKKLQYCLDEYHISSHIIIQFMLSFLMEPFSLFRELGYEKYEDTQYVKNELQTYFNRLVKRLNVYAKRGVLYAHCTNTINMLRYNEDNLIVEFFSPKINVTTHNFINSARHIIDIKLPYSSIKVINTSGRFTCVSPYLEEISANYYAFQNGFTFLKGNIDYAYLLQSIIANHNFKEPTSIHKVPPFIRDSLQRTYPQIKKYIKYANQYASFISDPSKYHEKHNYHKMNIINKIAKGEYMFKKI